MTDILLTVPARHLIPGDHTAGFVVSTKHVVPGIDGTTTHHVLFTFVVPFTTHSMEVKVLEKDLDAISFPLTQRGDDYSPNARNAALGLPPVPPPVYVEPEPIAVYPAGTRLAEIEHFDRGIKLVFQCPRHKECEGKRYMSKDPYVSSWFSCGDYSPTDCMTPTNEYVLSEDYKPTRNG